MPENADPATFILSDGKLDQRPMVQASISLNELLELHARLPERAKENTTLVTERVHKNHLRRILGASRRVNELGPQDVQRYVNTRSAEKYRGKDIEPDTIRKEVATLRAVWNWGMTSGYVSSPTPVKGVVYPKRDEKPPFMTWGEIERITRHGGLGVFGRHIIHV